MSSRDESREVVLARLRAALATGSPTREIPRTEAATSGLGAAAVVDRFADRVADYRATVHRCSAAETSRTIASILAAHGARRVGIPAGLDGAWLAALPPDIEVLRDDRIDIATMDTLDVVVTASAVAIAETGTIVLDASDDQGRRALTLVPDHHLCVVDTTAIVHTVPEGLARMVPTRPLTMISGPSATSDIELDRVEGVHGPRSLDVVIVGP